MKGWWVKMEIDEFTGHYIDKTDEEIVKDVRASVVDFIRRNPEGETFGAKMVRKMDDRISGVSEQNSINGKKGAEARWSRNSSEQGEALVSQTRTGTAVPELRRAAHSPAPVRMDRPKDREEFHAFVAENNLHEGLAEEWWDINERRGWVDIDGKPYKNWRGALKNYCNKTEAKRTA